MASAQAQDSPLKIDLGCGSAKREGFIGLDYVAFPGVDYVLDLTKERWPLADGTVDHVYSSHLFEHIFPHDPLFREIGRVCRDGATIEIWTPYAFSNGAFLYTHVLFLTEMQWLHICCEHPDVYREVLGGRWLLRNVNFVVPRDVEQELLAQGVSIDFAIRYYKSVVSEFGIEAEFRRDLDTPVVWPSWTYSHSRFGDRFELSQARRTFQERKDLQATVEQLRGIVEQKNAHIKQLEALLQRIENGRVLRIMRRFGL
jgi:SAM-dependent methyltransferase